MDEGDMYESEVITFVAPKKNGWLKKKSTGERLFTSRLLHLCFWSMCVGQAGYPEVYCMF